MFCACRFQRGLKRKPLALVKKLRKAKMEAAAGEKPEAVRTHLRNMIIVPEMIGSVVGVYNGKTFNQVKGREGCENRKGSVLLVGKGASRSCEAWYARAMEVDMAWRVCVGGGRAACCSCLQMGMGKVQAPVHHDGARENRMCGLAELCCCAVAAVRSQPAPALRPKHVGMCRISMSATHTFLALCENPKHFLQTVVAAAAAAVG